MKKPPVAIRKENRPLYVSLLLLSLIVFWMSAAVASSGSLPSWEKEILLSVYDWATWLRPVGIAITQFGSAGVAVAIALFLLTGREPSQHHGRLILVNSAVTYLLVHATKQFVGRPRPVELVQNLQQHDILVSGLGFPSGHTALATAISLVLMPYLPRQWRWLPILWILLVAFSRVFLGVHAPLDVIGGAALGLAVVSTQRLLRIR